MQSKCTPETYSGEKSFCIWCCQRVTEISVDGREIAFDLDETGSADLTQPRACFGTKRYAEFLADDEDEFEADL